MSALDLLGADAAPAPTPQQSAWHAMGAAIVGGVVGLLVTRDHPVVGFVTGYDVGGTLADLRAGRLDREQATRVMGRSALAAVAATSLPVSPVLGYVAGAIAGDMLLPHATEAESHTVYDRARAYVVSARPALPARSES